MKTLSVEWFQGIPDEKKQQSEAALRGSILMVNQLQRICDKWEAELTSAESRMADYDTPSWAVKQAHRNGDRARIRKLRELLSFLT